MVELGRHKLGVLLCQLHVLQGLLAISQLGIGTGQHRVGIRIVWSEPVRDLKLVNRFVVSPL